MEPGGVDGSSPGLPCPMVRRNRDAKSVGEKPEDIPVSGRFGVDGVEECCAITRFQQGHDRGY